MRKRHGVRGNNNSPLQVQLWNYENASYNSSRFGFVSSSRSKTNFGLNFFFKVYLNKLKLTLIKFLKNSTNNEKLECMEYICDKIYVTEFEKNAYILQN
jgi:hypothetical protein